MPTSREATVERVRAWLDTSVFRSGGGAGRGREAVIPLLQAAQEEFGYVPREAMDGIARALRLPSAIVQGIATFYAQFRFKAPGRHNVTVCRGTACHVRGSGKLLDDLQGTLRVRPQETSADGMFTLETVACFGSCALAPVISIDGRVHGQLSAQKAKSLIASASREGGARGARKPARGGAAARGRK
ncbi:MAG: NAD(P)H-dependent oxidoreductase subunit E [Deltaproteobacteria bacterium]|nr:NAD(P)H-dependent oxidoreductase subunit E [Deltaproteobacteria bacterium]